jgi:hypothetical protein
MRLLFIVLFAAWQVASPRLDVSTLSLGAPNRIVELDLDKLKGELRRLSWSPDATQMCVMTVDGDKPTDKSHVYVVAVTDGSITRVDGEPDWAMTYWTFKSDRYAPGLPSVEIGVEQKLETRKIGTGSAGALDRESDGLGANNINSVNNLDRAIQGDKQNVIRLSVFGSTIAEFVNTRLVPGLTFGWGPEGAAAIAFVDTDGRLYLLDSARHKRAIAGVKGAILPAWTTDGSRLAYLQKTDRKKYALITVAVSATAR